MAKKTNYDANELTHLEGLEYVRKRPGMYLGSTNSSGLQHTVAEIMDNSVDEALAGYCTRIDVTLHADDSVEIADNGRGIPVDIHKKTGLSGVEGAYTLLHFGGKFGGSGYKSAGGLHGVGSSVVNAVSTRVDVEVCRDEKKYLISFARGKTAVFKGRGPNAEFEYKSGLQDGGPAPKGHTGTKVRYWPDKVIFLKDAVIAQDYVINRARQTAFLVPGLTIHVKDLRDKAKPFEETFKFNGGIKDMVDHIATDKPICDIISIDGSGTFIETIPVLDEKGHMVSSDVERTVEVHLAMRWGNGYDSNINTFVNVVTTPNGGTHKKGFERALVAAIRKGYEGTRLIKANEEPPILEDCFEGLTAVLSVGLPEPQFVGQTKEELGTQGVTKIVQDVISQGVAAWIEGRKKAQARVVLEKIANASKTRIASRTSRESARRKTAIEGASMPAKLVDCAEIGVEESELFLVEGDSALGCFTGDTLIRTTEGAVSFEDMIFNMRENGKIFFGYATDKTEEIYTVPLLEPRITKTDAKLVSVILKSGAVIRCTLDHLFMLSNRDYRRADELMSGDVLASVWEDLENKNSLSEEDKRAYTVEHVAYLGERENVYDLTVEDYHNFALDCGVFVHNSARAARDSKHQALLPLRGKILNVQKASLADMLNNAECAAIIQSVGAGSGRTFDIEQMRYQNIFIMADADVDGSHIRVLLIVLFAKYMRPVITEGRLYTAMPPLHKIEVMGKGGETIYTFTNDEMLETVAKIEKSGKKIKSPIQRFKGLGEMSAEELSDTTLSKEVRSVRRITMGDVEESENILQLLMGDDVAPRRDWLISNSETINLEEIDS